MKKVVNKKKVCILVIALIVIAGLAFLLFNHKSKGTGKVDSDVTDYSEELKTSFDYINDGDIFCLQGLLPIPFDNIYIVIDNLSREEICRIVECDDEAITDKGEDDVEIFTMKDGRVNAIMTGPISELNYSFERKEGSTYKIYEISSAKMTMWKLNVKDGVRVLSYK